MEKEEQEIKIPFVLYLFLLDWVIDLVQLQIEDNRKFIAGTVKELQLESL